VGKKKRVGETRTGEQSKVGKYARGRKVEQVYAMDLTKKNWGGRDLGEEARLLVHRERGSQ